MGQFRARLYSPEQGFLDEVISAGSEAEAAEYWRRRGWRVVSLRSASYSGFGNLNRKAGFKAGEFSQELLTLLDAGMSVVEATDVLAAKAAPGPNKDALIKLQRLIGEGVSFSAAMEKSPECFPVLLVAAVRSSEQTGNIQDALRRYILYEKQINVIRDKFIAASIYPCILILVSAAIMVFIFTYVVPRFARIYADMGNHLSWTSRLMMQWGQLLAQYGWIIGLAALSCLALCVALLAKPSTRAAIWKTLWRLPHIGALLQTYELARFTRTLSMLQRGGVPFVPALEMTKDLLRQPALRSSLDLATRSIAEGKTVSATFAKTSLATEVGVRLLAVGERSGALPEMLERVADLYDAQLAKTVEWISRMLEPILMMIVALVIGVVILLMYLPIFELASITS